MTLVGNGSHGGGNKIRRIAKKLAEMRLYGKRRAGEKSCNPGRY